VEVARDDHAALNDEALGKLTDALADDRTTVESQASGVVLVRMTVDATSEWAARSAAEDTLRAAANDVWTQLGLPPFTVTFVGVDPEPTD
jgi:hypothetical protein